MWVWIAIVFAMFWVPFLAAIVAIWLLSRGLSPTRRILLVVTSTTLLLTPSWGPATIVAVPVPFGFLLCLALFAGTWGELVGLVSDFAIWHLIAFPTAAVLSYVVVRLLLSGTSLEPTR